MTDKKITEDRAGSALDPVRFAELVEWCDGWLDAKVSDGYKAQPLAQDWARVAKVVEEAGEALNELIAITGQNPRKGFYSTEAALLKELADVALTGLYAIQHFTKDVDRTLGILMDTAEYHQRRILQPPVAASSPVCGNPEKEETQ